jgi:hypothetical protein
MLRQRTVIMFARFGILASLSACSDKYTTVQVEENRPPKILLWGPEYDTAAHIKAPLPQPWVLATDPNGADDIAAVVLKVSSVTIVSLIVRPDDPGEECSRPFYAAMDTIDLFPYLRRQTFSIPNQPLQRGNDGVYTASLSYRLLTEGGIGNHGDAFGQFVKFCRWGYDYLYMIEQFGLYPPALSTPRDVYVTYAEFFVSGMSITVYDQSGVPATVGFPDFYGIFTNTTEDQTPP